MSVSTKCCQKQLLSSKSIDFPLNTFCWKPFMCTSRLRAGVHPGAKGWGFFSARPLFPVRLLFPQIPVAVHCGESSRHSSQHRSLQFLLRKSAWPETSAIRRWWEPEGLETHAAMWYHSGIGFAEKSVFPQQGHPFSEDSRNGQHTERTKKGGMGENRCNTSARCADTLPLTKPPSKHLVVPSGSC